MLRGGSQPASQGLGNAESFQALRFQLCRDLFAVLRRGGGLKRAQKVCGDVRDGIDGRLERSLVRLGGLTDAADLADELQGGGADLAVGDGRVEVEEELCCCTSGLSPDASDSKNG